MIKRLKHLKESCEWKYIVALTLLLLYATWPKAYVSQTSHVVCLIFDISSPDGRGRWKGWHPVTPEKREEIGLLVNSGAMEWMEAPTADCYERSPANPDFGKLVRREYVEWYRWLEKPKKKKHNVITH